MRKTTFNLLKSVAVISAALMWSCEDHLPTDAPGSPADHPIFKPSVGSSWSKGAAGSRSSDALIRIDSIDAMDGDMQLYLVSEEEDLAAYSGSAADNGPASRGITSTSIAGSFGLSAICYNSSSEAGDDALRDLTANFASNLETRPNAAGSTYWEPADRLVWPGSGRIRFMGYAPYASAENGITYDASGYPTLSFSVKESVKDQVDLLTAVKDVSGKGGEAIDLTFNHALAAITVRSGEKMLSGTITKVAIKNVYKAGKLPLGTSIPVWTATGEANGSFEVETKDAVLPEAEGSPETYTIPGLRIAGISKGENGTADDDGLTFFMIPQTLPDGAKLEVTLTDKKTGNTWTLSAPLAGKHNDGSGNEVSNSWEPGKLYTYAISTQGIVVQPYLKMVKKTVTKTGVTETGIFSEPYEGFAEHDPTKYINIQSTGVLPYSGAIHDVERTAYMTITLAGGQSKTVAADDIKMEYSTDRGSSWTACDDDGWIDYDPVAAASKGADDPKASRTGSLILPKLDGFKNLPAASSAKSGVTDLSATESANCYMINSPGDYSFRTVYGNSLKGGSIDNSVLTLPAGRKAGMKYFVDHRNAEITNGDIATQLSGHSTLSEAFILWQDSPGLISRVKYENGVIKFHVDERTIAEGNAIIALRDSNHDIVWSWHIWVTDKDWSAGNCIPVNDSDGTAHKLAPSMLGRCEARSASSGRDISLRFSLTYDNPGGKEPITVTADRFMTTKNGTDTEIRLSDLKQQDIAGSAAGDNTYYQWGRKDAMIPGIYTDTVDPASTSASNNAIWGFTCTLWGELTMKNKPVFDYPEDYKFQRSEADNGVTLGYAISNPHRFVMGVDEKYPIPGSEKFYDYRKHWHNPGSETYVESGGIMYNAWNSKNTNYYPNDAKTVGKTIYDPCPPGYHVPIAKVFNGDVMNKADIYSSTNWPTTINIVESDRSWSYTLGNERRLENVIYATGVRDFHLKKGADRTDAHLAKMPSSWPAFKMLTYITSASIELAENSGGYQVVILYFDNRGKNSDSCKRASCLWESNNSYGMTVWAEHD